MGKKIAKPATNKKHRLQQELDEEILSSEELAAQEEQHTKDVRHVDDITTLYDLEEEGEKIDMTTLDQGAGKRWKTIFTAVALLVIFGSTIAAAIMLTPTHASGEVQLSMAVPESVTSGDVIDVEITFTNNEKVALRNGLVEVFYPKGFHVESTSIESQDSDGKRFAIEHVEAGKGGKIRIRGQLLGTKEQMKEFSAQFSYTPENFSQEFQVSAKAAAVITSSIIEVTIEAPKQVSIGDEFEYIATIHNTGSTTLKNVKVLLHGDEGYELKEGDPKPYARQDEWRYEALNPGEEKQLKLTGVYSGASGQKKSMRLQVGVIETSGTFNIQTEHEHAILAVNPDFQLSIETPEKILAGETVDITLKIKNMSGVEVKNVEPVLKMNGLLFEDSEKTFDKIPTMGVDEEVAIRYSTTLKKLTKAEPARLDFTLLVPAVMIAGEEVLVNKSVEKIVKVSGVVRTSAEARYFDSNLKLIGTGSMPPEVGETTEYVIQWKTIAAQNPLSDATFTTTLPAHVTWEDSDTVGMSYNRTSRVVTFKTNSVKAGETLSGTFTVSITPTASDRGSLLVLTNETVFAATDAHTGESIHQEFPRLSTDLQHDEGAEDKGIVQ